MISSIERLHLEGGPEQTFLSLRHHHGCVWLDSARQDERIGRYSFLTADPFLIFQSRGQHWTIEQPGGLARGGWGKPLQKLSQLVKRYSSDDVADMPFPCGGAFGYFAYDFKNRIESRPNRAKDSMDLPQCWFGFYDWLIVFDHLAEQAYRVGKSGERGAWNVEDGAWGVERGAWSVGRKGREAYLEMIMRAKEYIAAGDIYQVNLSHQFQARTTLSAADLYLRLRETNPAPFAAYLDIGEAQVLSSSPERFLRLSGRHIQTRPIKGTRARSGDEARDQRAARELMMSEKDQAELVMITDLERNDLGRVCDFGSVHVPELVRLEEYATVFHLVSTVEGRLREGVSHVDAVGACFPGGSITGAPKIRAMEIIDELETSARGVYTGAIGYFGFNGESDFSIAIRTMIQKGNKVSFHAGSGIVADSDPAAEYEETLAKASGMIAALRFESEPRVSRSPLSALPPCNDSP